MASKVVAAFGIAFFTVSFAGCRTAANQSNLAADETVAPADGAEAVVALPAQLGDLKNLDRAKLDALFLAANGDVEIPLGRGEGYPILIAEASALNSFANSIWGGKSFKKETLASGEEAITLKNYVGPSPLTLTVIKAKVFNGRITDSRPSLAAIAMDEKPSIVLDYGDQSLGNLTPFNKIVDEIRLVNAETGLYIGRAHLYDRFICYFALQFAAQ